MKKATITIPYDEEKLFALKMYMEQRGMQIEDELTNTLDIFYTKYVPTGVREYLKMCSGNAVPSTSKVRRQKPETKPTLRAEVSENE